RGRLTKFQECERSALRALTVLNAAEFLDALKSPGASLERLRIGSLKGFRSLRVSRAWRLCFRWESGDAYDVTLTKHYR
ncbi:MAG: type II toxin-antitoxin system RelE/ParE family toxin, partial [Vulcanimicrobiaceae bacterium]